MRIQMALLAAALALVACSKQEAESPSAESPAATDTVAHPLESKEAAGEAYSSMEWESAAPAAEAAAPAESPPETPEGPINPSAPGGPQATPPPN
jgi:hypothetical protein